MNHACTWVFTTLRSIIVRSVLYFYGDDNDIRDVINNLLLYALVNCDTAYIKLFIFCC